MYGKIIRFRPSELFRVAKVASHPPKVMARHVSGGWTMRTHGRMDPHKMGFCLCFSFPSMSLLFCCDVMRCLAWNAFHNVTHFVSFRFDGTRRECGIDEDIRVRLEIRWQSIGMSHGRARLADRSVTRQGVLALAETPGPIRGDGRGSFLGGDH